jgi:hypothetical protein
VFVSRNKKASLWTKEAFPLDIVGLFYMAIVTLGGAALFFVTVLAGCAMGGVLVDFDLRRSPFVAGFATELVSVHFMVEGYGAFFAVVGNDVSSIGYSESKSDQHYSNNQFLHVSLLWDGLD